MPCFHPLRAYRSRFPNKSGKHGLVFKRSEGLPGSALDLACGQCIGCRLDYSRQWAVRCVHEAQLHEANCFITLTYNEDELPEGMTLVPEDLQLFFKRLRRKLPCRISHFSCGEYGDENRRPHYHSCIFGWDFPDRVHWKTENGNKLYRSELLESVWELGHSVVADFSFEVAAYVARYVVKKRTGRHAKHRYESVDLDTGEIFSLVPEFARMSLNPAIAKEWWNRFGKSVKDWDSVVINGKEIPPPRYYDELLSRTEPSFMESRKAERVKRARRNPDNSPSRLAVREEVKRRKLKELRRKL